MGAITEECLLNVPVFQNEIRIHSGHRSTVSRGIRSEVGREVDIARIVRVPHPQLDLMASQRIPTVIELFAQRRVKIPGCHFFVAQPLAVHLFERRLFFGVGQEYAFG